MIPSYFCSCFSYSTSKKQYKLIKQLMTESKIINLFKQSTQMYCQGNYSACLALLSDCLTLESDRSILYSNRAIANYHLKQLQGSFDDLQLALKTNHLNYIAYFNLFSLHFLNGNNPQAFRNLCLCLSSAYTILCRMEPTEEFLEQSIHYSFNNKESLFLLGVLKYEKSQLRASLQLFKRSLELEIHQRNREGVIKHIHSIQERLGQEITRYSQFSSIAKFYTLQTNLPCPSQAVFEENLTRLLKEFNEVYRLINDQMQMEHEFKENTVSRVSGDKNSILDEKDIYRATTYNSTAYSRAVEPQDQRSTMMLMSRHRELKLLSIIADDQRLGLQENKNQGIWLYPLKNVQQRVRFFVDFAKLSIKVGNEKENNNRLYALLRYKQDDKSFQHRTSLLQNGETIMWSEWTDHFPLPSKETDLEIKILNKRYTSFKDDLLASGRILINRLGSMTIPLYHNQQCNGSLFLTVETQ